MWKHKLSVSTEIAPKLKVSGSSSSSTSKAWDPACDKTTVNTHGTSQDSEESTSEVEYVTTSNEISYQTSWSKGQKSPRDYRFNDCHHIKRQLGSFMSSGIKLEGEVSNISEKPYEEGRCGVNDWVRLYSHTALSMEIRANAYLLTSGLLSAAPDLERDPYLGYMHGETYTEKMYVLDCIALSKMIPKLDTGFSMPRFLFELIELKFLWKDILKIRAFLNGTLADEIRHLPSDYADRVAEAVRRPLKEISDDFLSVMFGWLPMLRDVQTIFEKLMNARDDVSNFLDNAGKRMTLHTQKALHPETFQEPGWFEEENFLSLSSEGGFSNPWAFARDFFTEITFSTVTTRKLEGLTHHATMEFEYRIDSEVGPFLQRLFAELDYWGINLSVSDVWAVIPFSFIIDWVLNVSQMLQRFDKTNLPVDVVIYDYCRSLKYKLDEQVRIKDLVSVDSISPYYNPSFSTLTPGNEGAVQLTTHSYHRVSGIPQMPKYLMPEYKTPKGLHWVLATALGISRIKPRKRKPRRRRPRR